MGAPHDDTLTPGQDTGAVVASHTVTVATADAHARTLLTEHPASRMVVGPGNMLTICYGADVAAAGSLGSIAILEVAGGTFQANSVNLADPAVPDNLTLGGGIVAPGGATAVWKSGSSGDSVGGLRAVCGIEGQVF